MDANSRQPYDVEGNKSEFSRKKTLVRPDRARLDPSHPQYHYAQRTAQQGSHMNVQPSATGNDPSLQEFDQPPSIPLEDLGDHKTPNVTESEIQEADRDPPNSRNINRYSEPFRDYDNSLSSSPPGNAGHFLYSDEPEKAYATPVVREYHPGEEGYTSEIYNEQHPTAVDEDTFLRQNRLRTGFLGTLKKKKSKADDSKLDGPPPSLWRFYCYVLTFWAPPFVLKFCGMPTRDRQMAWREKIGLISIILLVAAFVAYLTFGFTATVCDNNIVRIRNGEVDEGYLIIQGRAYDLTQSKHPAAHGVPANSNILYPPVNAGGQDASFLFQNVNGHCLNVLTPTSNSTIASNGNELAYYMPCRTFSQNGSTTPNFTTEYYEGYACHTSATARKSFWNLKIAGEVYFTWEDIRNASRNLVVFNGNVLDLDLIEWIDTDSVEVPSRFYELKADSSLRGNDVSQMMAQGSDRKYFKCLADITKVGYIDSDQLGCIASKVVLYVSLVFIVGIVAIKFLFACYFKWFVGGKLGATSPNNLSRKAIAKRDEEIEEWSNNMYAQGPVKSTPQAKHYTLGQKRASAFRPRSMLTLGNQTMSSQLPTTSVSKLVPSGVYHDHGSSRSSLLTSDDLRSRSFLGDTSYIGATNEEELDYQEPAIDVATADYCVPQPPLDYQPFGYPLAHAICLITAYSESIDGLRTTLDSVATTDYPNSHKIILIVCDGIIKGTGNYMTTPDIALSMMKDFSQPPETVQPHSYVSVVSGSKRHNMAKVYAGFYKYDNNTMDLSKQQRVPVITVVKCGTPAEDGTSKPGNRGKRDSQIILMSFLQRVMFDERMTELEYEIFNGIWKVTGIAPDFYEVVLMVDADTKVYPDSITHMVASMVKDPEIMGLCGETKIANKRDSWVTMIQVFEYFISHHQSKAFESIFGGVTCLPGCFCMYRIKAPKGEEGYWVPILANPDIVERYAENVVDTLHKKNLLLLGEDRFLSTLMLKTFPKRKQVFVPRAVCKTIVPNQFRVLLSQRRRWINSTVHNLMELVLVRDLCGVFCISMQFVVFIELVGTLILPAAITFTFYVVIISIVKKPTPVLSLVLLALILGLPGLLIVVTASRWSYLLWMLIYLLSLPIWNFVLPVNAYWRFDDFSWGDTRTIAGGDKGAGHEATEGEFDSSYIVMRRWRDFEREKHRSVYAPPTMGWTNDDFSTYSMGSSLPPQQNFRGFQSLNPGTSISEIMTD